MTFEFEPGRLRGGEERDPWWFVVDPILILSVAAITAMGTLLVFSATRGPATELIPADTSFLERQVFFAILAGRERRMAHMTHMALARVDERGR